MAKKTAAQADLTNGRRDTIASDWRDLTRCLSCRKLGAEDSGDSDVWQWKWADGLISAMPRGLKPRLCIPCARAATLDEVDEREDCEA